MEALLKLVVEQGGIVAFLGLSLAGNVFLLRLLIAAKENHLQDIKETKDTISGTLISIKDTETATKESVQILTDLLKGHLRRNDEL